MSGGRFDYIQYRFPEIVDRIEQEIRDNDAEPRPKDWFEPNNYSEETLNEFRKGIECIKKAQIYIQRIDYLLSCDDSEETFHKRLSEDLAINMISDDFSIDIQTLCELSMLKLPSELGYREDKTWGDDEKETYNKLLQQARELSNYIITEIKTK